MKEDKYLEDLTQIRSMMEQSSRFLSLSGLSGISAGLAALVGAFVVYWKFKFKLYPYYDEVYTTDGMLKFDFMLFMFAVAAAVVLFALIFGIFFTSRKAKKDKSEFWSPITRKLLINLGIPLAVGGIFCLSLIYHNQTYLIGSATLIFYGLALLNASKYTLNDIRYLGISELVLGVLAAFITGYSLVFWAIGFGVLHIVYGYVMYLKYDK